MFLLSITIYWSTSYLLCYLKQREPHLLRQHAYSTTKCTASECFFNNFLVVLANCFPETKVRVLRKMKFASYHGYWKDMKNQKAFLDNLASTLSINTPFHCLLMNTSLPIQRGIMFLLSKFINMEVVGCWVNTITL